LSDELTDDDEHWTFGDRCVKGSHEDMTVQRVIILGRGGAGKSTVTRQRFPQRNRL
jgi:hypothetical protein